MKDYLYYCSNCNSLISDAFDDEDILCDECKRKMIPLHITEDEWDSMQDDEKRALLTESQAPVGEKRVSSRQKIVTGSVKSTGTNLMKCPNCGKIALFDYDALTSRRIHAFRGAYKHPVGR